MLAENSFEKRVKESESSLNPLGIDIIQVNVGLKCNKKCRHCHLKAGPDRIELMDQETMERITEFASIIRPKLVDITGGAPELNSNLKNFIKKLRERGHTVQVRTNLTVLLDHQDLIEFYTRNKIKLVASLPCYEAAEVDSVRGKGTFEDSITILKKLNEAGYGREEELPLDLVFNPEEAFLPPPQGSLEETYHRKLKEEFDIDFNNLITIANMPVGRFKESLQKKGKYVDYMTLLKETYNTETVEGLMCRHQINIAWDGSVYDCDFNLAMNLPIKTPFTNINSENFTLETIFDRTIVTGEYCFGCTAGQGSSCGGALTGT